VAPGQRDRGVPPSTTGLAVGLTALVSDVALLALFLCGLIWSLVKSRLPAAYVATAALGIPLLAGVLGSVLLAAFRPSVGERLARTVGGFARHRLHISRVDPERLAAAAGRLSRAARSALTGRSVVLSLAFALANWLLDVSVLYLFFLAVGHHQHFGGLLVAYSVANMLAAIPLTPGGLGVIEATLIAISVGFGAPHQVAVIAVLGYRLVNFWLPLPAGAIAYLHLRRGGAGHGRPGQPHGTSAAEPQYP